MRFAENNPIRAGAIGLAVTVIVVLACLQFDRLPLVSSEPVYAAYFADAAGLKTGDQVVVAGVPVGEVRTVDIADDNKVKVTFTASGVVVGDRSRIGIHNRTVLGSRQLTVTPAGSVLGPKQVLGLDHTSTPYVLTDTLGELTTQISGIRTQPLNNSLDELSKTIDAISPQLDGTLAGVQRLSSTISTRDEALTSLLKSASSLGAVLDERSSQINTIILDGNTLLSSLLQRRAEIDTLVGNIGQVARQLSGFVTDNRAQIGPALDNLNQVLDLLNKHREDINNSIKPLQQYAQSLGESVASGPFFKAFVTNLLPGQFLQPFIDAAWGDYQQRNPLPAPPVYHQGEPAGQTPQRSPAASSAPTGAPR